jgi:amino acid transporter
MLTGLGIAVVIYMLVAISVVAVIPPGQIAQPTNAEAGILLDVVKTGTPDLPIDTFFPFLTVFAVANTALINMLMASRLIYGMARQDVLPRSLGKVLPGRRSPWTAILFTTLLALGLIAVVTLQSDNSVVSALSGTTATLLLAVFTVVNVACLVLRRDPAPEGAFKAPRLLPVVGAVCCAYLLGPWARTEADMIQYKIAGGLLVIGVVLWLLTWLTNRGVRAQRTGFRDIEHMEDEVR